MSLTPGSRLGPYQIVAPIGAGGMGEVYRARDPRLDRDVAIKVLPASLAADADAVARFEREAMSVARLSHPNVLTVHEFGRDGGTAYVVMELIDGETLRARLGGGPVPPRRAVAWALQIARGLAAAHARGIVHRDLKPENVMITRDDQVKILDFGLAKPVDAAGMDMTRGATGVGQVLGTIGYMAPEQVRGQAVDHRADMFAFGAVFYEMLAGRRAFAAETAADTMTAILTREPEELDAVKLSIAPGLERIVRRCLEKSPDLRFQSANDLAFALDTLSTLSSGSSTAVHAAVTPATPRASRAWVPWGVAVAAIVAAGVLWYRGARPASDGHWDTFTRVTDMAGEETTPALSPDGTTVIYAMRAGGSWDIYSQRVGGRNATPILADPNRDELSPAFSPDGTLIAFHESDPDGGIFVAGATGESTRRVTDFGFDPTWSPDGSKLAFTTEETVEPSGRQGESQLFIVDVAGGTPKQIVEGDAIQAAWSPRGDRIAYWSNTSGQRDLYTVAAGGGPRVAVTSDAALDWSPAWSPDGRELFFASDRGGAMNLWRIPIDPSTGGPAGPAESVVTGVHAAVAQIRFSRDGTRMAFRSRVASVNPVAIPFDPVTLKAGAPRLLDTRTNIRVPSAISPDGRTVALFNIGERQEDLFLLGPDGQIRRVTDDAARDRVPVFMPDGRHLLFYSTRGGAWGMWSVGVDGGDLRQVLNVPVGVVYPMVSPKGDVVVFGGAGKLEMYSVRLDVQPLQAERMAGAEAREGPLLAFDWSADATRLVGTISGDSGMPLGVGVYDFAKKATTLVSRDSTFGTKFLPGGRRILYFTKAGWELVALDLDSGARTVVSVPLPGPSVLDIFTVAPDGRTIYYGAQRAEADIWVVDRK